MTINDSTPERAVKSRRPSNIQKRLRALELLRAGLITHAEAAFCLNISRQAVWEWCRNNGIDAPLQRHRHLKALFDRKTPLPPDLLHNEVD